VETTLTRYPGMIHGFFPMGALVAGAREAVAESCQALRSAFGSGA
jgi:acetyl esterase/lipase